jgi:quercetin dioxygenase-like cupin family protein
VNLKGAFVNMDNLFSPKITGEVNDQYIKVLKIKGQEVPWHNYENEEELCYIIDGQLLIEVENQLGFTMEKGYLFAVKKGTNHRVSSKAECLIMLIEPKTTKHTGKVKSTISRSIEEQIY